MSNFISLKKVSKFFLKKNKIRALKNINLNFRIGRIYSIIGPSGSGKSTLLNLISLIDKPTSGSISIENKIINYEKQDLNDLYRSASIGIIYQNYNLLNDFTALENIYLAGLAIDEDKNKILIKAKKLLSKIGLSKRENHFPSELSGGEIQRIAICRAIINEPQIILADEPTGNLDKKNSVNVFRMLLDLINKKRTIIFATHNIYFSNLADCKLELNDGMLSKFNVRNKSKKI